MSLIFERIPNEETSTTARPSGVDSPGAGPLSSDIPPLPKHRRDNGPDCVRGMLVIFMVYGHLTMYGSLASQLYELKSILHSFKMPALLMISGFFFRYYTDAAATLKKSLNRIGRPYLFFALLYLTALTLAGAAGLQYSNQPPSGIREFIFRIFIDPIGGYWFLYTLLILQLIIGAVSYALKAMPNHRALTLIVAFIIAMGLASTDLIQLSHQNVIAFFYGALTAFQYRRLPSSLVTGIALTIALLCMSYRFDWKPPLVLEFLLSFSALLMLNALGRRFASLALVKVIAWVGRNTLVILVLHCFFVSGLFWLSPLLLKLDPSGISGATLTTILVIVLCMASSAIMDKLGCSAMLFGTERIYSPSGVESWRQRGQLILNSAVENAVAAFALLKRMRPA